MIIRHVKKSNVSEMFQKFRDVSITLQDISKKNPPKSGFYEYKLKYSEFEKRALSPLSLVCIDDSKVVSYLLSLQISEVNNLINSGITNPVFNRIKGLDKNVIYFDQLLVSRDLPAHAFAARILQTGDRLAQEIGSPGAIGATPVSPWYNLAPHNLIRYQGFMKKDTVKTDSCNLGLYVKPYWKLDTPFENFGNDLILPN